MKHSKREEIDEKSLIPHQIARGTFMPLPDLRPSPNSPFMRYLDVVEERRKEEIQDWNILNTWQEPWLVI